MKVQNKAIEELNQLRIKAKKTLSLSPEEILEKHPELIKSIVIENGKIVKLELYRL